MVDELCSDVAIMAITSKRLKFSRLSSDDLDLYTLLTINEEVMKFITGKALTQSESEQRFRKSFELTENNPGAGFFIVRNKMNCEFVGVSKLVQWADNQYEIGYMLLPEFWGKGLASEMVEYLIKLAQKKHLTGDLIGIVDPENPASIRVLTKFCFELYDTGEIDGLAAAYYKRGIYT
jgi:[ribosomal protein S5]-alanine N-acetyltransferase